MTRETEAIDWSAPIEAYHPDGRVVAVEHVRTIHNIGHHMVKPKLDGVHDMFLEDGAHTYGTDWRIRNRRPAQQWGDPIEVNGERPVWLGDDDAIRYQNVVQEGDHWVTPPAGSVGRWGGSKWHRIQRIRLAADHWAYEALSRGMVPWAGGDEAPDDWGGGEVLRRGKADHFQSSYRAPYLGSYARNQRWGRYKDDYMAAHDIIGYKRREQAERLALDPELVDRMVQLVRDLAGGHTVADGRIADIAAELPPEPVDPVVARAREIVAGETDGSVATSFRAGERDSVPAMRAVIRALREGMGDD